MNPPILRLTIRTGLPCLLALLILAVFGVNAQAADNPPSSASIPDNDPELTAFIDSCEQTCRDIYATCQVDNCANHTEKAGCASMCMSCARGGSECRDAFTWGNPTGLSDFFYSPFYAIFVSSVKTALTAYLSEVNACVTTFAQSEGFQYYRHLEMEACIDDAWKELHRVVGDDCLVPLCNAYCGSAGQTPSVTDDVFVFNRRCTCEGTPSCGPVCTSTGKYMIWDENSEYPDCGCICAKGFEMRSASCVACETLCQEKDRHAHYDDKNSVSNRCSCTCDSGYTWDDFSEVCDPVQCRPNSTAVTQLTTSCPVTRTLTPHCCCDPQYVPWYGNCIEEEELPAKDAECGKRGCEEGENCESCKGDCPCKAGYSCNPSHPFASEASNGCVEEVATIVGFACVSGESAPTVLVKRAGTREWIDGRAAMPLNKGDLVRLENPWPGCAESYITIQWPEARARLFLREKWHTLTIGRSAVLSGWPLDAEDVIGAGKTVLEIATSLGENTFWSVVNFLISPAPLGTTGQVRVYVNSHMYIVQEGSEVLLYTKEGNPFYADETTTVTIPAGKVLDISNGVPGKLRDLRTDEIEKQYLANPWCAIGEVLLDGACYESGEIGVPRPVFLPSLTNR